MPVKVTFSAVQTPGEINRVAFLADIIWKEHYTPIIGEAQVDYMLEHFQSEEAIAKQLQMGVSYYNIQTNGIANGYLAFEIRGAVLFLSKIYLLNTFRGKGIGKAAIGFIEDKAKALGCAEIALTVNKYNNQSITAYTRMGFVKKGAEITDIGSGFVMDDFRMVKKL